jgi:hypothetical protein
MNGTSSNLELGDVVRRFGPAYIRQQGKRLLPSQRKALQDIMACHTAELGGHRYHCQDCGEDFWVYHGCGNRSCPSCHSQAMRKWIEKREDQMLGCRYFHVIVTIPQPIRAAFLAHQKILYGLLMTTAASCVMDLMRNPKVAGATPAILAVLHTWRGDLDLHPHVHLLVSAGGVSEDGRSWMELRHPTWLLHVGTLSLLVRRRFQDRLEKAAPEIFQGIETKVWDTGWNSFCKPYGKGVKAILNYLGRYVYRIAISNHRLLAMDDTHVTFRCKTFKDKRWRILRLRGEEFLRRFVMHVLPRGFHKVRYYGLWHHCHRDTRNRIRLLLAPKTESAPIPESVENPIAAKETNDKAFFDWTDQESALEWPKCPRCKSPNVIIIDILNRNRSP